MEETQDVVLQIRRLICVIMWRLLLI